MQTQSSSLDWLTWVMGNGHRNELVATRERDYAPTGPLATISGSSHSSVRPA
jgi:hypothetical protein